MTHDKKGTVIAKRENVEMIKWDDGSHSCRTIDRLAVRQGTVAASTDTPAGEEPPWWNFPGGKPDHLSRK